MNDQLGGLFLHTCGPSLFIADLLGELAGLEGFETAFIDKQDKTTEQLFAMKEAAAGRYTICSFGLPDGRIVSDEERFTPDVLRKLSENGHFAIQAYGTWAYAEQLAMRLEL